MLLAKKKKMDYIMEDSGDANKIKLKWMHMIYRSCCNADK
jgi:hypothetical protein